jgi:small subunit ribosomal protein S14
MARKSMIVKSERNRRKYYEAKKNGINPKFPTKIYNRCFKCGRVRGYIRDFGMCRICIRELASTGEIPGMRKSSW